MNTDPASAAGRPPRLAGRRAVVTASSRGIGLAIAHRLVDEGAKVVMTGRDPAALEEAAAGFPEGTVLTVDGGLLGGG